MRKVILKMNKNYKYEVIKKLVDTDGNKKRASIKLNCTTLPSIDLSLDTRVKAKLVLFTRIETENLHLPSLQKLEIKF